MFRPPILPPRAPHPSFFPIPPFRPFFLPFVPPFFFFFFSRALVGHSYLQDAAGAGLSQLVDIAVAQGAVGTVLSTDADDGAVFGFVTALPLRYLARENECVQVCRCLRGV